MAAGYPQAAYAPPPLPERPSRSGGGGGSLLLLLVVLVVAAVGGYVYYTKFMDAGDSEPPATPIKPMPDAATLKQMTDACVQRGIQHGKCQLNAATNEVSAMCHNGYYGLNCSKKCMTGGTKATKYTAGFEGGVAGAATCVCPSTYHFKNADPQSGCETGSDTGDQCEAGYHGENCDKTGEFVNCQNGTQNATTGACDCRDGWQGEMCQYPKDWCTKKDAGATMPASTCVCSAEYKGARCTEAAAGYVAECQNGGTLSTDKTSCSCVAPYYGEQCEHKLPTCKQNSGPGCKTDGTVCTWGRTGADWECGACKPSGATACCSGGTDGCLAAQTPVCKDLNTYPCATSYGHFMKSGGVEMTADERKSLST